MHYLQYLNRSWWNKTNSNSYSPKLELYIMPKLDVRPIATSLRPVLLFVVFVLASASLTSFVSAEAQRPKEYRERFVRKMSVQGLQYIQNQEMSERILPRFCFCFSACEGFCSLGFCCTRYKYTSWKQALLASTYSVVVLRVLRLRRNTHWLLKLPVLTAYFPVLA